MKNNKKGFTLIELIVVIAIIGVLAAILVPAMMGYVKKSKIRKEDATAKNIQNALASALPELEEQGWDISKTGLINLTLLIEDKTDKVLDLGTPADDLKSSVKEYFPDIKKVKKGNAYIQNGICVAVISTTDNVYCGTYPPGHFTAKDYKKNGKAKNVDEAIENFEKDCQEAKDAKAGNVTESDDK